MKRRLALKSEYLSELTANELTAVAGGATVVCLTGVYPTLNTPCPTQNGCVDVAPLPTLQTPCPTIDGCFTGTTTGSFATC